MASGRGLGDEPRRHRVRGALGHAQRRAAGARVDGESRRHRRGSRGRSRPAACPAARRRQRQPRERGSPPKGCDGARDEALDDAVLERVEADHREPAAGSEAHHDPRQRQRELRELAIDENPKSLEGPRGRILTPITPRARADGLGHDRGQLPRADDGCDRASRNNRSCNRLSKPFFTIVAYHLRQFARIGAREEIRGRFAARRDPSACRAGRRARSEKPRSGSSICGDDTPRSSSTPSTRAMSQRVEHRRQLREPGAAEREARVVDSPLRCRRRPDRDRARRACRRGPSAARIARLWPPRPNVPST